MFNFFLKNKIKIIISLVIIVLISWWFINFMLLRTNKFALSETGDPFLDNTPYSAFEADTLLANYHGIDLYYITFSTSAITTTREHIIKYRDSTNGITKFFYISFIGNPMRYIKEQKDTLLLYFDSNPNYLNITTSINEKGRKSYYLQPIDKKNMIGYFFSSDSEGIFKFENNSWIPVDSYENEGRYMLTPFQYQKAKIIKIPMEKILKGIKNKL